MTFEFWQIAYMHEAARPKPSRAFRLISRETDINTYVFNNLGMHFIHKENNTSK